MIGVKSKKKEITPAQIIVLGFAFLILAGAVLLIMPFAAQNSHYNAFIDALFISTSAVCVTGLVTVDPGTFYSVPGQVIVLVLIQVGGLGIISAATIYALISGKRIGLKERILIKESLNRDSLGGVVRMMRAIVITTLMIEGVGVLLLTVFFMPYFPAPKALWYGLFHAISAFCNAGFDIFGPEFYPYCSLIPFQHDPAILLTISLLIILGGLGFIVILKCMKEQNYQRLSVHSKLAISTTAVLLVLGTLFFLVVEHAGVFGPMNWADKLVNAFFMSTTPRTAGYAAVNIGKLLPSSLLITMFLMFVGASPGGTGGGIKTTTFAVLLMAVWARIRGHEDIHMYDRRIDHDIVYTALTLTVLASAFVFLCILILTLVDPHDTVKLMFEAFSAFGTVGLSTGITPELTSAAKLVLIVLMFFGRLGPLTIAFALLQRTKKAHMKYPRGSVIIG